MFAAVQVCFICGFAQQPAASPTPAPTPAAAPTQVIKVDVPSAVPAAVEAAARTTAQTIVQRKKDNDPNNLPNTVFPGASRKIAIFALAAAADPAKAKDVSYAASYIAAVETHRTDKQLSSSASTGVSTSAADKPGIPYLLGLAIDHGAIAQNINGSALTLTSSPYAVIAALQHEDTAELYQQYSGFTRFAVSASYNLQDQNNPLASVQRKQLTEWAVKFRVFGDHSARSQDAYNLFVEKVLPALQDRADKLAKGLNEIFADQWARPLQDFTHLTEIKIETYLNDPKYDETKAEDDITEIIKTAVQQLIYGQLGAKGVTEDQKSRLSQFLIDYKSATDAYVRSAGVLDDALNALDKKATLTLGYFNERFANTPNYSVGKLMYEKKPDGFMQIDANLSFSAYSNPDATKNQQTFRDATAALQFQQNLGRSPFLINSDDKSQISLAFAGRYERLQENRHIPGKKADIAVANWKIEIPIGQGVSLPLSITYANATELIKEQDIRGNFGITFDLDKLHALATAK